MEQALTGPSDSSLTNAPLNSMPDPWPHPGPADWLTIPGRLLPTFTLAGWGALLYFHVIATAPELPRGRYPVVLWVLPITLTNS